MKLCKNETAAFYGIGMSRLEDWMSFGLPYKIIHRNRFEFDTDAVDRWLVANGLVEYVDFLTIKRFAMTAGISYDAVHRYIDKGMPTAGNRIDGKEAIKWLERN